MEHQPTRPLDQRVVIVTGAGSEIGQAAAVALTQAGAHVLGVGRRQAAPDETATLDSRIAGLAIDICADEAREALPHLRRSRGSIINISSTAACPTNR